jgi:Spy/CpxP family protein refolding chaperone
MRKLSSFSARPALLALLSSSVLLPACGGSQPPPEPPPIAAPPPPVANVAPPPPPPAPAPVAAEAPPPEAPKPHMNHQHMMAAVFLDSIDSLDLTAEQKAQVEPIKADMVKHGEVTKDPRTKLEADVSDGVNAGKIDHAKTDADIKAMAAAVAATQPAMQDDMNRLHQALTPEQRKKLVETIAEKAKHMHEHEHEGMDRDHSPMTVKDKGGAGPADHAHEHETKGGGHMGEDPMHGGPGMGMGMGEEGMLSKLTEALALTPDQKDKLRMKLDPMMKSQHMAMKDKMMAGEKHMMAIGVAFSSDKFDAKKAGVGSEAPDTVKTIATAKVQFVDTVLSVLTPEQRPKFLAQLKEHEAEMD